MDSAAIAPFKNRDFWGVDQDALSIKQFIKRYLTANNRWNSPKFLFGESYGTARTCVLAWMLHEDGIDLNGVTLQSSVLDYPANFSNASGLMPSYAADAWYHQKTGIHPPPADLPTFMNTVTQFSSGPYAQALSAFPHADPATVQTLSQDLGIAANVLTAWGLNVEASDRLGHSAFLMTLLQDQGLALGAYDGRVTAVDTGIAAVVSPDGGMNDPTMAAVGGVYTAMWNTYLNTELLYTATSNFVDLNDQAFQFWDFRHTDPTGAVQTPAAHGETLEMPLEEPRPPPETGNRLEQPVAVVQSAIEDTDGLCLVAIDQDQRRAHCTAPRAASSPRALARVSSSSRCGSESATMPAPARKVSSRPLSVIVRIRMVRASSPVRVR